MTTPNDVPAQSRYTENILTPWRARLRDVLLSFPEPHRIPWDRGTWVGLLLLAMLWAGLFSLTYGRWGDLSQDCGREMYVPAVLASGRTLYTNVWYPYTPAAPYLNSLLFQWFGIRLGVLYWAGALSALSCSGLLYLSGLHLLSRTAAWTVGAVVLLQAFQSSLFSFPLGYSFGAVYAYLAACLCLWLMINGCSHRSAVWILLAGFSSAAAFAAKPEIGIGCFAALAVLVLCRALQDGIRKLWIDLAAVVPGLIVCAAIAAWMVSLRGVQFLTQENLMSWPTSYFMRNYGRYWLNRTGLGIGQDSPRNLAALLAFALLWLVFRKAAGRFEVQEKFLRLFMAVLIASILAASMAGAASFFANAEYAIRILFFPPALLLLVALILPLAFLASQRRGFSGNSLKVVVSLSLAVLIAPRSLLSMNTSYAIYTNGPAVLALLFILSWVASPNGVVNAGQGQWRNVASLMTLAGVMCLVAPKYIYGAKWRPIPSFRGTVYTRQGKAGAYIEAIHFIQAQARQRESVLSVPEDASLYFLAGVSAPLRVYAFTPGLVAPGKMANRLIREMENRKIRYLLWSNILFDAYPVREFGVDYDRQIGTYLMEHYEPAPGLPPFEGGGWRAVVWERKPVK